MKKLDKQLNEVMKLKKAYDTDKITTLYPVLETHGKKSLRYKTLVNLYTCLEYGFLTRKEFDFIISKVYGG